MNISTSDSGSVVGCFWEAGAQLAPQGGLDEGLAPPAPPPLKRAFVDAQTINDRPELGTSLPLRHGCQEHEDEGHVHPATEVPHRGRRDAPTAPLPRATETQAPRSGDERSLNAARLSRTRPAAAVRAGAGRQILVYAFEKSPGCGVDGKIVGQWLCLPCWVVTNPEDTPLGTCLASSPRGILK